MLTQTPSTSLSTVGVANGTSSESKRVLIYCHDTYGLGHLRRSLKISLALKAAYPHLSILIVTGSSQAGRYPLPEGTDFIKLPSVVKTGESSYEPRSLKCTFEEVLDLRQNLIFEAVRAFRPHLMIVDHSPLGMKGEIQKALFWLKDQNPQCHLVLGLRDIIDEPDAVLDAWLAEGIHEVLDQVYTQIFVYGTPEVFDPVSAYQFSGSARAKTSFTGFITDYNQKVGFKYDARGPGDAPDDTKEVFLTVGGGGDGIAVVDTYLSMLCRHGDQLIPIHSSDAVKW
jgi:predicted glycosyltransferase